MPSLLTAINKHKEVLFLICLCIVSRLPQLLSENLVLDGDEAVYGLMVKHFIEGKTVPPYFYGQAYGFIGLELPVSALFFQFFGVSDIALKVSMFLFWIVAIIFHYLAFMQVAKGKWQTLCITTILVLSSSWALWSLKARGGYQTAFLLSSILLYLLLNENIRKNYLFWAITGILLSIIFESQALWLLGLFPIMAYTAFKKGNFVPSLTAIGSFLLAFFCFQYLKKDIYVSWAPPVSLGDVWNNLANMPDMASTHFRGSFVLDYNRPTTLPVRIFGTAGTVVMFIVILLGLKNLFSKEKGYLPLVSALSILLILAFVVITDRNSPRYLLPLSGFVFLAVAASIQKIPKRVQQGLFVGLGIIGIFAVTSFRNFKMNGKYPTSEKAELLHLIDYLEKEDVHHVFSTDALVQFQLMFYSNESIVARCLPPFDRYPPYVDAVNHFYLKNGTENMAWVNYFSVWDEKNEGLIEKKIGERFIVILSPSKQFLQERGFNLPDSSN